MTETALLRLDKISLKHQQQSLLSNISLSLSAKQIMTIIGPNGAGKSTLIKVALGLTKANNGTIYRRPGLRIGYMPQRLSLNPLMPLSVSRFLAMAKSNTTQIDAALARTGIQHLRNRPLHDISGGETQRVLLSRALLSSPDLLVLDEPAQGVDISGQTELYELINALRDDLGCAVLMVSHDLHWVMAQTDTVICLNQHICCHGHPEQVSSDPEYLALFGRRHAEAVALYQHDHDHQHDIHGDVVCEHKHHD
ncbi:high-affinity zinc transporter ATPase [gamma proteobacterium BDW918]|uniref:Mn2+/Zn2+ABC transporter ATP-binding protein n=1 Tax=Zhongshania aliphaticivorans TaxID=1470434 RepID=A0A127M0R0_9GAMM|nr:zinc ABC transporter ATP-binding protein ZnuC [Zhongshania aliphaticivorans]AMO66805.1 Mn2+/Zn2+ABC transporter ATP-binding protein [Zhongshania aliphaticivorans]EIF41470.1 high-affinity zinc transporter ATPase [gamma proteobacterium BDW918]